MIVIFINVIIIITVINILALNTALLLKPRSVQSTNACSIIKYNKFFLFCIHQKMKPCEKDFHQPSKEQW